MSKRYYCIEIEKRKFCYHSIKFFVCKAKNKKKAIKKFYKEFNKKDEYEIKNIYPLGKIKYNDTIFCLN